MKTSRRSKAARRSNAGKAAPGLDTNQAILSILAQILIHVMGDAGQQKKALALRNAGLSNAAIAGYMGTSPEVIGTVLYNARRQGATKKGKKTATRKRKKR